MKKYIITIIDCDIHYDAPELVNMDSLETFTINSKNKPGSDLFAEE